MGKIKKMLGTVCHSGVLEICGTKIKSTEIDFEMYNNGFDGEKYESAFSFVSKENRDLSIDFYFDEIEIKRTIDILKKHLKNNRHPKKLVKINDKK